MPRTKGQLEIPAFQQDCIVGQYESGLSQRKISENLLIPLFTENKVIVKFNREHKGCTVSHSGRPGAL